MNQRASGGGLSDGAHCWPWMANIIAPSFISKGVIVKVTEKVGCGYLLIFCSLFQSQWYTNKVDLAWIKDKSQDENGYYQGVTTDVLTGVSLLYIVLFRCLVLVTCCVKLVFYCILMSTEPFVGPQQKNTLWHSKQWLLPSWQTPASCTMRSADLPRVHLSCVSTVICSFVQVRPPLLLFLTNSLGTKQWAKTPGSHILVYSLYSNLT